jgi:hypothetical protein
MKLGPSWEAASREATQELHNIIWNQKVHYRVHKSILMVPILYQINAFHTVKSRFSEIRKVKAITVTGVWDIEAPTIVLQ